MTKQEINFMLKHGIVYNVFSCNEDCLLMKCIPSKDAGFYSQDIVKIYDWNESSAAHKEAERLNLELVKVN